MRINTEIVKAQNERLKRANRIEKNIDRYESRQRKIASNNVIKERGFEIGKNNL